MAAHRYLAEKKPTLAVPEFRAVLAADPGNLDAQANLGVLLYFQGDGSAAEPLLRAAVAQKPDLVKLRALLGLAEKGLGEGKTAQSDLEAAVPALTEVPIRVQAGLALVELDVAMGQTEKAAEIIAGVRSMAPTDPRVLYAAYRLHTDLAGEALLGLSMAAPNSAQLRQATAHELEKARDEAGAIANFRKAVAIDPRLPGIHYELAEVLRSADDPTLRAQAAGEYQVALAENSQDVLSMVALGGLSMDANDAIAARRWYEKALAIDPAQPDAAIGEARVLVDAGDAPRAAKLLEQVVVNDPTNISAHFRLSAVYRKLGRPEEAKQELAAYQKYKEMKEQMRAVYKAMREEPPSGEAGTTSGGK